MYLKVQLRLKWRLTRRQLCSSWLIAAEIVSLAWMKGTSPWMEAVCRSWSSCPSSADLQQWLSAYTELIETWDSRGFPRGTLTESLSHGLCWDVWDKESLWPCEALSEEDQPDLCAPRMSLDAMKSVIWITHQSFYLWGSQLQREALLIRSLNKAPFSI